MLLSIFKSSHFFIKTPKPVESSVWLDLYNELSLEKFYCQPTHKWSVGKSTMNVKSVGSVYFHIPIIGPCVGVKKSIRQIKSSIVLLSNTPKSGELS